MAEGTKLVMSFKTASSDNPMTLSFKYGKPSATTAQIRTLATSIISNGEIFEYPPTEIKSAKMVTTSETVYDLSNNADPNSTGIPFAEAVARGIIPPEEY